MLVIIQFVHPTQCFLILPRTPINYHAVCEGILFLLRSTLDDSMVTDLCVVYEYKVQVSTTGPFSCLSIYILVIHEKNKIAYYFI